MERKNLLEYGFKRVIEELKNIQRQNENTLQHIAAIDGRIRHLSEEMDKIRNDLLILEQCAAENTGHAEKTANSTFITQMSVLGIEKGLKGNARNTEAGEP